MIRNDEISEKKKDRKVFLHSMGMINDLHGEKRLVAVTIRGW